MGKIGSMIVNLGIDTSAVTANGGPRVSWINKAIAKFDNAYVYVNESDDQSKRIKVTEVRAKDDVREALTKDGQWIKFDTVNWDEPRTFYSVKYRSI